MSARAFRRKASCVQAVKYHGWNYDEILLFLGGENGGPRDGEVTDDGRGNLYINTSRGRARLEPGDWVIKGVDGFYPCPDATFQQMYEEAA